MRFRLLGPLEVRSPEGWTAISAGKWRSLLACLLLRAGEVVSAETLIDELWGDSPPPTANNLVSIYIHRLRGVIGDAEGRVLVHRMPGYQLRIHRSSTDLYQFESLVAKGRHVLAADNADRAAALLTADRAAALLTEAEDLWRGEFLADVAPSPLVRAGAGAAAELRLTAAELRIEAELTCGRHAQVIPVLRALVAEQPLREKPWLLLMRALAGTGRQAEALDVYGQVRGVLADELGVDPGTDLQREYEKLLTANPAGTRPRPSIPPPPAQLPADIGDFTGRDAEVELLRALLTADDGRGSMRAAVIAGMAGLGKTALAVHVAHQVTGQFPDGQLYAALSGASSSSPASPGDVLARFLRDLGVSADKIPEDDGERAALYRTLLTGRRMMILLDDAKDAAQVRPLLPGSSSCAVLVTTRYRELDLGSARSVSLDVLSDSEALELFARLVGDDRPGTEPDATAEALLACAGLPLAIRICAARLSARRQWKVAAMADRLRDKSRRLDELQTGDRKIRAVFQVIFDSLRRHPGARGIDLARAFCFLGLWNEQEPTISLRAAAVLLGMPEREDDVADAMERLVDATLVESPAPDEYRLHSLLRVYAAERANEELSEHERTAAVSRLRDWLAETVSSNGESAEHRAPGAVAETTLAKLRDMLAAQGIAGREQAAALCTALIQSWPENTGAPAPVSAIPDVPGYQLRPDPLNAKTPAEFVGALARLRQWAGEPPFREMERRCGHEVASATICTALGSDKLPSQRVVLAIVTACGGDEDQKRSFITAWRQLAMAREPGQGKRKRVAGRGLYPVPDTA